MPDDRRDETPVTLPAWVVMYLVETAYGQFTLAEAITTTHSPDEIEVGAIVAGALHAAESADESADDDRPVPPAEWTSPGGTEPR